MSENIKIRTASQNDITELLEIQNESRLSNWSETDYTIELKNINAIFSIAEVTERTIAGFALARFTADRSELDLLNIGVARKWRKQGIGELLLQTVITEGIAKHAKTIWLEVRESNADAVNLYLKNGFEKVQRRKEFYTRPTEDALVMRLDL